MYKSFGANLKNGTNGGEGASNLDSGYRERLSNAGKEFYKTEAGIERRKEISENMTGKVAWNKGLTLTDEKYKGGLKNKGKKASEETKAKMRESAKTRPRVKHTEESKQKIRDAKKGCKPNISAEERKINSERMSGDNNPMSKVNIEKRKALKENNNNNTLNK
jgi:hypothetical protein